MGQGGVVSTCAHHHPFPFFRSFHLLLGCAAAAGPALLAGPLARLLDPLEIATYLRHFAIDIPLFRTEVDEPHDQHQPRRPSARGGDRTRAEAPAARQDVPVAVREGAR
jgi:hypothetical protein